MHEELNPACGKSHSYYKYNMHSFIKLMGRMYIPEYEHMFNVKCYHCCCDYKFENNCDFTYEYLNKSKCFYCKKCELSIINIPANN